MLNVMNAPAHTKMLLINRTGITGIVPVHVRAEFPTLCSMIMLRVVIILQTIRDYHTSPQKPRYSIVKSIPQTADVFTFNHF